MVLFVFGIGGLVVCGFFYFWDTDMRGCSYVVGADSRGGASEVLYFVQVMWFFYDNFLSLCVRVDIAWVRACKIWAWSRYFIFLGLLKYLFTDGKFFRAIHFPWLRSRGCEIGILVGCWNIFFLFYQRI